MIVERAVRDADGVGDLAQTQALMAGLGHPTIGGLEGCSSQIAMAIGRPARFWRHAPSYKATGQNATAGIRLSSRRAADHPVFAILRGDVLVDHAANQLDDRAPRPRLGGGMRRHVERAQRAGRLFRAALKLFRRNDAVETA